VVWIDECNFMWWTEVGGPVVDRFASLTRQWGRFGWLVMCLPGSSVQKLGGGALLKSVEAEPRCVPFLDLPLESTPVDGVRFISEQKTAQTDAERALRVAVCCTRC